MCSNHLKYHTAVTLCTLVHPLPSKWTVLPFPMHAVDASKHPRKSSCFILCQDSSSVFCIGCSQVMFSKAANYCSAKSVETIKGGGLGHACIVVLFITRSSVCKHPHGRCALLK